jgi:hypothetical protein
VRVFSSLHSEQRNRIGGCLLKKLKIAMGDLLMKSG